MQRIHIPSRNTASKLDVALLNGFEINLPHKLSIFSPSALIKLCMGPTYSESRALTKKNLIFQKLHIEQCGSKAMACNRAHFKYQPSMGFRPTFSTMKMLRMFPGRFDIDVRNDSM